MAVGDAHVFFPGFFRPVLTQLFLPKPPTVLLTCFCRGERRKYAEKKSHLNRGLNSQQPGHEFTELSGLGEKREPNASLRYKVISTPSPYYESIKSILLNNSLNIDVDLYFDEQKSQNKDSKTYRSMSASAVHAG